MAETDYDNTEFHRANETKTRLSEIIEAATDFVGTITTDGRFLYINKAGRNFIEIGQNDDISHLKITDLHPKWTNDLIMHEAIPTAIREGSWNGETAFRGVDGYEIPFSHAIIAHKNPDGSVKFLSIIARNITEQKKYEKQIILMANYDPLTQLFNRRRFQEELERWLVDSRLFGTKGALLFLDIDNFKYVNDSFGHHIGDKLLLILAKLLKKRLREADTLARLGGDEFAIILPFIDSTKAELIANQIRELIQNQASVEEIPSLHITASIGIALFPTHSDRAEILLTYADLAMYRVKENGRNSVCIYSPDQKKKIETELFWENRIKMALIQNRFSLYLQPIMDLHQNHITGHEVLLRMIDEKGEIVMPTYFLSIAEHFGLIHQIDRWVVYKSIHFVRKLQQQGKPTYLEINLSGKSFTDTELLPLIKNELAATGINPADIVFEITETAIVENILSAQNFINEVKAIGCHFALDDFCVGFASFNYLKLLPVDYLKIDGSFIVDLCSNSVDQHLVKAMVEVANGLGKKTIAEYVNSEETVRLLKKFGVGYAQGYYIGKPFIMSEA